MAATSFGIFDHVDRSDEPIGVLYEQRLKFLKPGGASPLGPPGRAEETR